MLGTGSEPAFMCIALGRTDTLRVVPAALGPALVRDMVTAAWRRGIAREAVVNGACELVLRGSPWADWSSGQDDARMLVLALVRSLAARGWRLAACINPNRKPTSKDALFFVRSPDRCGSTLLALSLNGADRLRVVGAQQSGCAAKIFEAIRAAIAAAWPPGLRDEHARDSSHRFVLAGSPWEPHSDADTAAARRLVAAVVEAVLRVGFNVVACVHLQGGSGAGAQGAAAHEGAPHAVSSASASAPADRPSQSIPDTWIFQHALDPDLVPMPSFSRNDMQPLVCCAVDSADSLSLHAGPAELAESLASDLAAVWPQGVRLVAGSTPTIRFNGAPWRGIGEDSVHCRRLLLAVIASMARSGRRLVASAQISAVWSTPSLVFEASSDPPPRSGSPAARLCAVSLVETATLRLIPAHAATDDAAASSGDDPHTHAAARAVDAALAACGISASKSHFVGVPEWSLKAMDWTASGAPAAAARGLVLSLLEAMHAAGWRIVASCRVTSRADQCDTLVFGRSA
ncbi:hypothetical protein HK105_205651 [Polyrhizophydium stewartii]|uniref:Uncharacterized protein n=1 Tax=Polyrhizophydium stewartii TaxID=2732419 RepID=A0ABR4N5J1_9FUNG